MTGTLKDAADNAVPKESEQALPPLALANVAAAHFRLFRQIEVVNRIWAKSIEEAQNSETELSARLRRCTTTSDAFAIRQEWLARRVIHFVTNNHHTTQLWLDFARELGDEQCG